MISGPTCRLDKRIFTWRSGLVCSPPRGKTWLPAASLRRLVCIKCGDLGCKLYAESCQPVEDENFPDGLRSVHERLRLKEVGIADVKERETEIGKVI